MFSTVATNVYEPGASEVAWRGCSPVSNTEPTSNTVGVLSSAGCVTQARLPGVSLHQFTIHVNVPATVGDAATLVRSKNAGPFWQTLDVFLPDDAAYRAVAEAPHDLYHFEMGRALAERLGYPPELLDRVPGGAWESFAGVGYVFDLAGVCPGERVLDLGSGSGTDAFAAAVQVGPSGHVTGVDMTPEQLAKADRLRAADRLTQVDFVEAHIDDLPFDDGSYDLVISNGVINLAPDKERVFAEANRVLRPGGRLAVADIVTDEPLSRGIVCNADLWASCIGGAAQIDAYQGALARAGFVAEAMKRNPYAFVSASARAASTRYGVRSISLLARKPG